MKTKFGAVDPADLGRLRFSLNGPNEDFTFYLEENPLSRLHQSGANWTYRFNGRLPSNAVGSFSLGVEGYVNGMVDKGGDTLASVRDITTGFIEPFPVTDTVKVSRRKVVDDAKCESCHGNLSGHGAPVGGFRNDASGNCQTCHQTTKTDVGVRPAGTGVPQSVDYRYMIHKIHRGEDLARGYLVYGYGSRLHDYSDIEYVGDLRNCDACHVDESNLLPLPVGVQAVVTPQDFWTPMLPETASCLSCHDTVGAAAHADSNTTPVGEACATCHGVGKTYAVEKVHAR
jgi:OmcA/MtrC family decaheme c-type cytochrome